MFQRIPLTDTVMVSLRRRSTGTLMALAAVAALVCSALVPGLPILVGLLLVLAVALHVWTPDLQPWLQPILQVPVAKAATRRAHLFLIAFGGVALVVCGGMGAAVRGHLRGSWEQGERRRAVAEQDAQRLMQRVQGHLDGGDLQSAELALMEVERLGEIEPQRRAEFDGLLERVRRCGDAPAILAQLVALPKAEFAAFETSQSVPPALDFPEPVLTKRAVAVALEQLDEARKRRGGS